MGYWKSKVLPKIKKVFEKNGTEKVAAAEACKSFDESKEVINKEFEEKKTEFQPKVIEIYEASAAEIKTLVKERKDNGIKKNSSAVQKFLDELVKIEFPGSKVVCEASSKFGPAMVSGPVFFVFEKVSTLVVAAEKPIETAIEGTNTEKEKEIIIEQEKEKEQEEEKEQEKEKEKEPEKEKEKGKEEEKLTVEEVKEKSETVETPSEKLTAEEVKEKSETVETPSEPTKVEDEPQKP